MSTNRHLVVCPLCGALVPQEELKAYGYCQTCRLLIEALIKK
ncbi:unnamed protein product [marine sediment metagenome]|uniref:Uncharacterized protein n=1 Tax=marine sediment metagenome TaxID=412755 RepID=X1RLD7_9ZZZZ